MGEQMTREQIEAWLLLEGWVFGKMDFYVPMYRRHGASAFISNQGDTRYDTQKRLGEFKSVKNEFTDDQLQSIYQEIIKHEKD